MSDDGRHVAFDSGADNLVSDDTNNKTDIFIRDVIANTTQLVSIGYDGAPANNHSWLPSISESGRFVAFESIASNLVPDDTNATGDIFVRDLEQGTTVRVSVGPSGQGNEPSFRPSISASGARVAFLSYATNLVQNDTNGQVDIFVRDLETSQTLRVSVASDGTQSNGFSWAPAISGDGRYVAFESHATNLYFPDVNNGGQDIFVRDTQTGTTFLESRSSDGVQGTLASSDPDISGDGRYVVFRSSSTNLVANKSSLVEDIFLRDRAAGTTSRLSVNQAGQGGNSNSWDPGISSDGAVVVFPSDATNLVPSDTNSREDVFARNLAAGTIKRVSISSASSQANNDSWYPAISTDGRYVAFYSGATNLITDDQNGFGDVFRHDSGEASPPTILNFQANPSSFSPNGDGMKDTTTISFSATDESFPIEWELEILNVAGLVVRDWEGSSPSGEQVSLVWDGTGSSGEPVLDGPYSVNLAAADQWVNISFQSTQVRVDRLPPIIIPQSLLPPNGGNTGFVQQPLLAQVGDAEEGSGVNSGSIAFTLNDEMTATSSNHAAVSWNGSTWWAKTSPISLTPGHVYTVSVTAIDLAGNKSTYSHDQVSSYRGFLVAPPVADAGSASITSMTCDISSEITVVNGIPSKEVVCEDVQLVFSDASVQLPGNSRDEAKGFIDHTVSLSSAFLKTQIESVTTTMTAYPANETRTTTLAFDVSESTLETVSHTVSGKTIAVGTLHKWVPATWSSASLEMPATSTAASIQACVDPTIGATSRRAPRCSPDPLASEYLVALRSGVTDPQSEADRLATFGLEVASLSRHIVRGFGSHSVAASLFNDPNVGSVVPFGKAPVLDFWADQVNGECVSRVLQVSPTDVRASSNNALESSIRPASAGCGLELEWIQCDGCIAEPPIDNDIVRRAREACKDLGAGTANWSGTHSIKDGISQTLVWLRAKHAFSWDDTCTWVNWYQPMKARSGNAYCWWTPYRASSTNIDWGSTAAYARADYQAHFESRDPPPPNCSIEGWVVIRPLGINCDVDIWASALAASYGYMFWTTDKWVRPAPSGASGACRYLHSSTDSTSTFEHYWGNSYDLCVRFRPEGDLIEDQTLWPPKTC